MGSDSRGAQERVHKILVLHTRAEGGGAERQVLALVSQWAEHPDIEVELILLERRGPEVIYPSGVKVTYLGSSMPGRAHEKARWLFQVLRQVRSRARELEADVLVTFLWLPTVIGSLFWHRAIRKHIWSVQSDLGRAFAGRLDGRLRKLLVRWAARTRIERLIAISEGHRRRTADFLDLPSDALEMIPNCVDAAGLKEQPRSDVAPPKKEPLRILCIGRLHPQKGIGSLIESLRLVGDTGQLGWECWILGEGELGPSLTHRVEEAQLSDRVHFAGFVPDPYGWLATADLMVLPSLWEPFGIAVIEAMSLGVPVIATETDGPQDIIQSGDNGLLVPVGNPGALAEAINLLLTSDELRERLGRASISRSIEFDCPRIAETYLTLLRG